MPLMPGKGHVGENIREFSKGPTHAHTAEKFGEARAHKQDVAVALHQEDKGHSGGMDHKAAIAKMHPEHLHKMVQHAMTGKAGPEMQQMAQKAMQPQMPQGEGQQAPPMRSSPFSDNDGDEGGGGSMAPAGPPSRSSMFGMGGGE